MPNTETFNRRLSRAFSFSTPSSGNSGGNSLPRRIGRALSFSQPSSSFSSPTSPSDENSFPRRISRAFTIGSPDGESIPRRLSRAFSISSRASEPYDDIEFPSPQVPPRMEVILEGDGNIDDDDQAWGGPPPSTFKWSSITPRRRATVQF